MFVESMENNKQEKRPTKDTYLALIEYTLHIEKIFTMIRDMGSLTVGLWNKAKEVNSCRLEAITNSFMKYFELLQLTYGPNSFSSFEESRQRFEQLKQFNLSENIFSVEKILLSAEKEMVRAKLGHQPECINDLNEYFQELTVVGEESERFRQHFLRKEWSVKVNPKKMYGGRLMVTVDALIIRKRTHLTS